MSSLGNLYTVSGINSPINKTNEDLEANVVGANALYLKNSLSTSIPLTANGGLYKPANDNNLHWVTPGGGDQVVLTGSAGGLVSSYALLTKTAFTYDQNTTYVLSGFTGQTGELPGFNLSSGVFIPEESGIYSFNILCTSTAPLNTAANYQMNVQDVTNSAITYAGISLKTNISSVNQASFCFVVYLVGGDNYTIGFVAGSSATPPYPLETVSFVITIAQLVTN